LRHKFRCDDVATVNIAQRSHVGTQWHSECSADFFRKNRRMPNTGGPGYIIGQIATLPRSVMNSRRLMCAPLVVSK
jgi:hypothetical protein